MTTAVFDIAGAGQDVDAHGTPACLEGSGSRYSVGMQRTNWNRNQK